MHTSRSRFTGMRCRCRAVPCASHDIQVVRLLKSTRMLDRFKFTMLNTNRMNWGINLGCSSVSHVSYATSKRAYMMRKVRVHNDHKISGAKVQAVDISSAIRSISTDRVAKSPNTYPNPSFPARGLSIYDVSANGNNHSLVHTTLSSPYTAASCSATSWVPSGLASSTMMISQLKSLHSWSRISNHAAHSI